MAGATLKRINLMLEEGKIELLRREFGARNNSEAVRMAIDRELAVRRIQGALRGLRQRGTLEDAFHRAPAKRT
jgi:hypothetical protein